MIEIRAITLYQDRPGYKGYIVEARLVDEARGTHTNKYGTFLNWDKGIVVWRAYQANAIKAIERALTETLCV